MSRRRAKCRATLSRRYQMWYVKCSCEYYGNSFHDKNEAIKYMNKHVGTEA